MKSHGPLRYVTMFAEAIVSISAILEMVRAVFHA